MLRKRRRRVAAKDFNFAHGEFVLLGAYITYLVYSYGLPVWLGMLTAPLVVAAIGFILERLVIRRFYAVPIIAMLGIYALGLIIREGVRGLIGGLNISVPEPIVGSLTIAGVHLSRWRLAIVVITTLAMIACYLPLTRTSFGLRVRAALENPSLARVSGISTNTIYAVTFTFGTLSPDSPARWWCRCFRFLPISASASSSKASSRSCSAASAPSKDRLQAPV